MLPWLIINFLNIISCDAVVRPPLQEKYEFWLEIDERLTMSVYESISQSQPLLIFNKTDQKFYRRNLDQSTSCDDVLPTNFLIDAVPTADGLHRHFVAVNESLPGPNLVVFQNAEVVVHVKNNLAEPVTVHFHGLDQKGTFFMDGVAGISQCPMLPGEEFTYKFNASDHPGTYWYHGHAGANRGDGLYGAFVILDRNEAENEHINDFVVELSDWYPNRTRDLFLADVQANFKYYTGYDLKDQCYLFPRDASGIHISDKPWYTALINGRSWHNVDEMESDLPQLPLERFIADPNFPVRFRLINVAAQKSLRFRIDGHQLKILASDGYPIAPKIVDRLFIYPAERYDVELVRLDVAKSQENFKIRVENSAELTMNYEKSDEFAKQYSLAILSYNDDPLFNVFDGPLSNVHNGQLSNVHDGQLSDPIPTIEPSCNPCVVLNCPFEDYPPGWNLTCIKIQNLQNSLEIPDEILNPKENFLPLFVHFRMENGINTANGIQFQMPRYPPFLYPNSPEFSMNECEKNCGFSGICNCAQIIEIPRNSVVQLVVYSLDPTPGVNTGMDHSMHLHGHHFYLLKHGHAQTGQNGISIEKTNDLTCENFHCNFATWANSSWDDQIPDANLKNPIAKDSVHVPFGGYVVVRFKAENSGWWFLHCHLLAHHLGGMAVAVKVGEAAEHPQIPDGFPICGAKFVATKSFANNSNNFLINFYIFYFLFIFFLL